MKRHMTHLNTTKMLQCAQALIDHLITWGEVTRFELSSIAGAPEWITLLEKAGVLHAATPNTWSLSPELYSLLRGDSEKAIRTALFQIPEYRGYLISILAEGLASAAKQGFYDEVEKWSGNELLPFLSSINRVLNRIEADGTRIIDQKADQIPSLFASLPERQTNWDSWNQSLLGRTARPQDLFDFVLKRFVPFAIPEGGGTHGYAPTLLPIIPLLDADGNSQFINLGPAPWNMRRIRIQSGFALFDEKGNPLSDLGTEESSRTALQDALVNHPFYKAVTHLAIYQYRAKAALTPNVELVLRPGSPLSAVELYYETRKIGLLKEWLPLLVQCQECFAARPLNDEQVENMMENLLALEILDQSDDNLLLHQNFQSTLMASRLRPVFRPGKLLQERMIEAVRTHLHKIQPPEVIA